MAVPPEEVRQWAGVALGVTLAKWGVVGWLGAVALSLVLMVIALVGPSSSPSSDSSKLNLATALILTQVGLCIVGVILGLAGRVGGSRVPQRTRMRGLVIWCVVSSSLAFALLGLGGAGLLLNLTGRSAPVFFMVGIYGGVFCWFGSELIYTAFLSRVGDHIRSMPIRKSVSDLYLTAGVVVVGVVVILSVLTLWLTFDTSVRTDDGGMAEFESLTERIEALAIAVPMSVLLAATVILVVYLNTLDTAQRMLRQLRAPDSGRMKDEG